MSWRFVFRGHASDKYRLIPSALRSESKDILNKLSLFGNIPDFDDFETIQTIKEYHILRDFYKKCDRNGLLIGDIASVRDTILSPTDFRPAYMSEKWLPEDLWPLAALAQHFGAPTRLLDWTHDIHVALYFAIEDYLEGRKVPEDTSNMVLWALNLKAITETCPIDFPLKLVQPIYHGNDNLAAQQGIFTLWQIRRKIDDKGLADPKSKVNRKPLDELLESMLVNKSKIEIPYLYSINLPVTAARDIYKHIKKLGYDAARIYPGYYGVVKSLMHDYYLNSDKFKDSSTFLATRE